jgi:GNAT superfamily N-acetyltransferase
MTDQIPMTNAQTMTRIDSITISVATAADVPLILDLIRGIAEYEKLSHEVVATEALLREHLFGPNPKAEVRIARIGGQAVGFALFFHNFSTFVGRPGIYLEDLFVRPEFRGKGVGRALLRELARIATERKCGRLEWSVLDWNEPAIRFYESLGAKPMSEWTIYRMTDDAIRKLAES